MKIRSSVFVANILVITMILITFYLLLRAKNIFDESQTVAENNKYLALLAAELGESSKKLTESVRLYVANNDIKYKEIYDDVVNVRAGTTPRARDAVIAPGKRIALLDLLLEYGISNEEFALLEQANNLSDALIASEVEAMNAMQGKFKDSRGNYTVEGEQNKTLAMSLVFGDNYENELSKIQHPLKLFREKLNRRTTGIEKNIKNGFQPVIYLATVCLGISVFLALISYFFVHKFIVVPVERITVFAKNIGHGNLQASLNMNRKDEIGQMANALRQIPETLNNIIHEYDRLSNKIAFGELEIRGVAERFSGDFAYLMQGTNAILDRFCMLLDRLPSPALILDKQKRIVYLNAISKELVGTHAYGKVAPDVFAVEDAGTPDDALEKAFKTLQPSLGETKCHLNTQTMDIVYTVTPFFDVEQKFSCMLIIVNDVTSLKSIQNTTIEVAHQVTVIAKQTASSAEELATKVEQVSHGANEQKERVISTSVAMEEMNATVIEVSQNAAKAHIQAEKTQEKAREGAGLVEEVVGAIGNVNTVSSQLSENMKSLGKQAEDIGSVMSVISDIADQTNLLALNAAIEAARAGEAGRGFAVVADEVRKLAEKTMSATTEVGNSIRNIQQSTSVNITHFDKARDLINSATELANTSGQALAEIRNLAEDNADLIAVIATAAEEQSATSEEITLSVTEVNHIASTIAEEMETATKAVQELSESASNLQKNLIKLSSA